MKEILEGVAFWAFLAVSLFLIRPKSALHRISVGSLTRKHHALLIGILLVLIVLSVFVMTLSPVWNGEIILHNGQYEMMTESILQGRLDLDVTADPRLYEMENPYDAALRDGMDIKYPLDHAFYQGRFYMYFGIVPVFLAFLPYRLLTGQPLLSVHATQFFTAAFLIGLLACFRSLAKKYFPQMTLGMLIALLVLFSLLSVLFPAKFPTLYETPVACGMMLEIWSIFCFSRAFREKKPNRAVLGWALGGSLLGALTFGCRPPLALANAVVLPMAFRFLKREKITRGRIGLLLAAALPYALVAAGLMAYNYARFGSPFEFGQAYQLTTADQSRYGHIQGFQDLVRILVQTWNALFAVPALDPVFPFLPLGIGVFPCCPLLFFSLLALRGSVGRSLKREGLYGFLAFLIASVFLTNFFQVLWSPVILERYKGDVLYLLSMGSFLGIGVWYAQRPSPRRSWKICLAAFGCLLMVLLLFIVPEDFSYTDFYTGAPARIWSRITFHIP